MRRAGLLGALAVALGELALRPVLQPADRGDDEPHGRPAAVSSSSGCAGRTRPHLFEIVEGAHLRPEHVNDDVAGVDQHPVAVRHAFDVHVGDAGLA